MSRYMEMKAQIEELQANLETVRKLEINDQIVDIKKRIVTFGIKPSDLFSVDELKGVLPKPAPRKRGANAPTPPKYELDGKTWGGRGPMPQWYAAALASGKTAEQMLIKKS